MAELIMQETKDTYDVIFEFLRSKTSMVPDVGIICGSGLGGLSNVLSDTTTVHYKEIPGWPQPTVAGHSGELVFGTMHGSVKVVCMKGRFHGYEGHEYSKLCLGPRVMKLLGAQLLVVTNAAGGLNRDFNVGDIMVMDDHISFTCLSGMNPLVGKNDERFGPRFPPVSDAYHPGLIELVHAKAKEQKLENIVRQGCYCQVSGPNYESRAEVKFLRMIGADAVGMSTVPEVLAAVHCGMKVLGLSLITNKAVLPGEDAPAANHEEVIEAGKARAKDVEGLVSAVLKEALGVIGGTGGYA